MAVLEIITAPHPVLELRAREVEPDEFGPGLERHTSDMAETMYAAPGVGLAAPQVSDPRRILVIDPGEKAERGKRYFALVNPKIVEVSDDFIPWNETCLSVPEFEVEVKRHRVITLEYQRPVDGSVQRETFSDYEAVIVQHELDHLAGTLLLDHASQLKRSRYLKRTQKLKKRLKEFA
jgi:peptide deformylase